MTIHLTRGVARAAFALHTRAHRGHPGRRAWQTSAFGINLAGHFVVMTLPIDVSQQVIQAPRLWVGSDAGEEQRGCVIRTYFRKKHRAVFVRGDELWIERR